MHDIIKNNMEGSRNERVAILLASYVIGFITAYIAFGVIQLETEIKFVEIPAQQHAAAVVESTVQSADVQVMMSDTGLILTIDGEETLLSLTSHDATADTFVDGIHADVPQFSLSPDLTQVYYCESPSIEAESCRPYVYSITDEIVYPVLVAGKRVAFDSTKNNIQWAEDSTMLIK